MKLEHVSLASPSSPAECRAFVERRLGGRAARALRHLQKVRPHLPKLEVLPEDRARVLDAYDRRCAYCARGTPPASGSGSGIDTGIAGISSLGIDFLVPASRGGMANPANIVAACASCRNARRGRHLDVFLEERLDLDSHVVYERIARASARLRAGAVLVSRAA